MREFILEYFVGDELLGDVEFRDRLRRLSEPGRRLLLWVLEQQDIERDIQSDDDLSRTQMAVKIADSRARPVEPLSELEERLIREALENGCVSPGALVAAANAVLDAYFLAGDE